MNKIDAEQLVLDIKSDFTSLWNFKLRGDTLELITPFSTLAGSFISVFLTKRDDRFIVTEGQRLHQYILEQNMTKSKRIKAFIEETTQRYGINKNTNAFYYKTTSDFKLLSSFIYDIIFFYNAVFNFIFTYEEQEPQESRFSTRMTRLLNKKINENKQYNRFFSIEKKHDLSRVGFSIVLQNRLDMSLWAAMYISGSTSTIYLNHISRANTCFMIAKESYMDEHINLAAVFDDEAKRSFTRTERIKSAQGLMNRIVSKSYNYSDFNKISDLNELYRSA